MPVQTAIATSQRRYLVLEAIKRLSKTRSWVTQRDIVTDLQGQGYDVRKHHVLRDLKALTLIHGELECHNDATDDGMARRGVEFGYRWVSGAETPETGLSIPEALSLVMVSRYLKQALPATLTDSLERLFDQAEATLDVQHRHGAASWSDLVGVVSPAQPMLPPKVNPVVQEVIHRALIAKEQFRGIYRNANGEEDERLLSPLGLMVRSPSTYLVAVADGHDDPRFYALHRFRSAHRDYTPATQPEGFELAEFLEEHGNFGEGKWITLKATVNASLADILLETPLGTSQQLGLPNPEGGRELVVRVRDNWQLRWWLRAQGERIIVFAPQELREVMFRNATLLAQAYGMP